MFATTRSRTAAAIAATALFTASGALAAPVLIDFEGESAGTIIDSEFAPLLTVSTSSNGSNDHAVVFDTDNPTGNDGDLGAPFDNPFTGETETFEPGNVLIISEDARGVTCGALTCTPADDEAGGGTITFTFNQEVTFLGVDVFDVSDGGATFSIDFYGVGGLLMTEVFSSGIGDNEFDSYLTQLAGVIEIVFNFGGSGAIDNILFETSEVPIPAALPLLLSGLAGLSFASRRRKKA